MEYIMSDRNMNHSLISKLILLYVCFQFIECKEYTDRPLFLNYSANSDAYNCFLKPAFEETVAELGQVINKDNRLIELEITIESNSSAANRSYPSSMQWLLPITDSGKRLLDLPENYIIFSLGTLSFGIAQIHLHIYQEPDECLGNATSADVENLLQHMVLSLADKVDTRNKDRKDTIYICNGTVHSDGYCCKLSADETNVTCEDSLENFTIMILLDVYFVFIASSVIVIKVVILILKYLNDEDCEKHAFSLNDASFYVRVAISKDLDTLKYGKKFEKVSVTTDCLPKFREKLLKCISDGPLDISKNKTLTFRLNVHTLSYLVDNKHLQPETFPLPSTLTFLFPAAMNFFSTLPDRLVAVLIFLVIFIFNMPNLVVGFLATMKVYAVMNLILMLMALIITPLVILRIKKTLVSEPNNVKRHMEGNPAFSKLVVIMTLNCFGVAFYIKCLLLTMLGIILNYEKCFQYVILILMFFKFACSSVHDARLNIGRLTIRVFKTIRELSVESQCDVTNQVHVYILQENSGRDCFSRFAVCEDGTVSFLTSGLMVFNRLIQPENIYVKHIRKTFLNDVASLPGQLTPGSRMSNIMNSVKEIMIVLVYLSLLTLFVSLYKNENDISELVVTFVTFATAAASSRFVGFVYRGKPLSSDEDGIYFKELVRNYLTKHDEHLPIEESDYDLTCIGEQDESDLDKTCMLVENLNTEDEAWYVVPIKMSEEKNLTGSRVEIV